MLKFGLWQSNPIVGDVRGNLNRLAEMVGLHGHACDVVVAPECFSTGYPLEDLLNKPSFRQTILDEVQHFAGIVADGPDILLGSPWLVEGGWYNCVLHIAEGQVRDVRAKHKLPDHGVFDDPRIFLAGGVPGPIMVKGHKLGVMTCEDMWSEDVADALAESGAEIFVVLNGSPHERGKQEERLNQAMARVVENNLPLLYLNLVGGQDNLVFDGNSFMLNADRTLAMQMPSMCEYFDVIDPGQNLRTAPELLPLDGLALDYAACVQAVRDYVHKNGFSDVLLGLSGGIDSALVASMAVDALGAKHVEAIMMPTRFTSQESLEDAQQISQLLGITLLRQDIDQAFEQLCGVTQTKKHGAAGALAEENIQSRLRGMLVMTRSNMTGALVLTTGNKSEYATGYATLYGDMCGAFAPIKDIYKTDVFAMCRLRNDGKILPDHLGPDDLVMPERVISKPPSAELRPDQKDEESLGSYEVLDDILHQLIELQASPDDVVAAGHEAGFVAKVARLLRISEYKRSQAAPGPKMSKMMFTRERRYPITNCSPF